MPDGEVYCVARYLPNDGLVDNGGGSGPSTGRPSNIYYDSDTFWNGGNESGGGATDAGSLPPEINDPGGYMSETQKQLLRARLMALDGKISNADGSAMIPTEGGAISLSELYSHWLNYDLTVTHGISYGPNTGGAMIGGGTHSFLTKIDSQSLLGYIGNGKAGMNSLFFHELAHTTEIGVARLQQSYDAFKARSVNDWSENTWRTSPEFINHEQFINRLARTLADYFGEVTMADPPLHYGD